MLKLGRRHRVLQNLGVLQWGGLGRRSYRTVRLGAPAKLKKLHSKIGRRVDFARVRYGTMQSESMRNQDVLKCDRLFRSFFSEIGAFINIIHIEIFFDAHRCRIMFHDHVHMLLNLVVVQLYMY